MVNLEVISHPKSLAIGLIARLCEKGVKSKGEDQKKYKERVQKFVEELLRKEFITTSSSKDTDYLSTQTVLNRMAVYEGKSEYEMDNIEQLRKELTAARNTSDNTRISIDNFLLPLLTGDEDSNIQHIEQLRTQPALDPMAATPINNIVVKSLFPSTEELNNSFEKYYSGVQYSIDDLSEKSFVIQNFDPRQRKNLLSLLQLRDKLAV